MIFVTVGSQLPFDRLIRGVDHWLGGRAGIECVAQVGHSDVVPRHMQSQPFFPAAEMEDLMRQSDLIVAHAGIGTVITALRLSRPILVVPRQSACGEHRNDHQMATAAALSRRANVYVAMTDAELPLRLDELLVPPSFSGLPLGPHASPSLLAAVREFLDGGAAGA